MTSARGREARQTEGINISHSEFINGYILSLLKKEMTPAKLAVELRAALEKPLSSEQRKNLLLILSDKLMEFLTKIERKQLKESDEAKRKEIELKNAPAIRAISDKLAVILAFRLELSEDLESARELMNFAIARAPVLRPVSELPRAAASGEARFPVEATIDDFRNKFRFLRDLLVQVTNPTEFGADTQLHDFDTYQDQTTANDYAENFQIYQLVHQALRAYMSAIGYNLSWYLPRQSDKTIRHNIHRMQRLMWVWWKSDLPPAQIQAAAAKTQTDHATVMLNAHQTGEVGGDALDLFVTLFQPTEAFQISERDFQAQLQLALGGLRAIPRTGFRVQLRPDYAQADKLIKSGLTELRIIQDSQAKKQFVFTLVWKSVPITVHFDERLNVLLPQGQQMSAANVDWLRKLCVTFFAEARNTGLDGIEPREQSGTTTQTRTESSKQEIAQLRLMSVGDVPRDHQQWGTFHSDVNIHCRYDFGWSLSVINALFIRVQAGEINPDDITDVGLQNRIKVLMAKVNAIRASLGSSVFEARDSEATESLNKIRRARRRRAMRQVFMDWDQDLAKSLPDSDVTLLTTQLQSPEEYATKEVDGFPLFMVTYVSPPHTDKPATEPVIVNCPESASRLFSQPSR